MDTLSETADKVDQSLQNMGIDGTSVKQSIRDFLNFKEYLAEHLTVPRRMSWIVHCSEILERDILIS